MNDDYSIVASTAPTDTCSHNRGRLVMRIICTLALLLQGQTYAAGACPVNFKLSGNTDLSWNKVTSNAWGNMLPTGWEDQKFHFYSQIRDRGPKNGINTPSDLETEIRKEIADVPAPLETKPNRRRKVLPIQVSGGKGGTGKYASVYYDYDGGKSPCILVTFSFDEYSPPQ